MHVCMCVCVYVCMYVGMYVCMYVYMYVCMYVNIYKHIIHICVYVYKHLNCRPVYLGYDKSMLLICSSYVTYEALTFQKRRKLLKQ